MRRRELTGKAIANSDYLEAVANTPPHLLFPRMEAHPPPSEETRRLAHDILHAREGEHHTLEMMRTMGLPQCIEYSITRGYIVKSVRKVVSGHYAVFGPPGKNDEEGIFNITRDADFFMYEWIPSGSVPIHITSGPMEIRRLTHKDAHRVGGPAVVEWDRQGYSIAEYWRHLGDLHRTDGPAVTKYYPTEGDALPEIRVFKWMQNGQKHRDGGPAVERRNEHGIWEQREWWHHGELVRTEQRRQWIRGERLRSLPAKKKIK